MFLFRSLDIAIIVLILIPLFAPGYIYMTNVTYFSYFVSLFQYLVQPLYVRPRLAQSQSWDPIMGVTK